MKFIKKNMGSILICLLEILIGILLLINPVGFTTGIIIAAEAKKVGPRGYQRCVF